MSAYIDTAYVDAFIGQPTRLKLFEDDPSVGYVAAYFDKMVQAASARVDAALSSSGYPVPIATTVAATPDIVKLATFGAFITMAYTLRRGIALEAVRAQFPLETGLLGGIESGAVPIPGYEPAEGAAVGGFSFTSQDVDDEDGSPQIFSRKSMAGL